MMGPASKCSMCDSYGPAGSMCTVCPCAYPLPNPDGSAAEPEQPIKLSFGGALDALRAGNRVCREGWNGKGMWLCYMPPTTIPEGLINGRTKGHWPTGDLPVGGYIVMRTAQGVWQPGWLASQADMLADDWVISR